MKKALFFLVILLCIASIVYLHNSKDKTVNDEQSYLPVTLTPTVTTAATKESASIFVPYWQDFSQPLDVASYDRLVYFGVNALTNGLDFNEQGYKNLPQFMNNEAVGQKDVWLAVRMLNDSVTETILNCSTCAEKIAQESVDVVNQYRMKGIVLDLELSVIPFSSVESQINNFVQHFCTYSKGHNVPLAMAIYGDTFYRKRPFDIATLNKAVDEWYIMAYDFHKSRGEPGPNFPLDKGTNGDYDFKTMINDFLQISSPQKLNVVFGMYGYDWIVDEQKRPLRPANSLSDKEIQQKYIDECNPTTCVIQRDPSSAETEIDIVANNSLEKNADNLISVYPHIIWFEDLESANKKKDYLKEKGINKVGYWAYGYF